MAATVAADALKVQLKANASLKTVDKYNKIQEEHGSFYIKCVCAK